MVANREAMQRGVSSGAGNCDNAGGRRNAGGLRARLVAALVAGGLAFGMGQFAPAAHAQSPDKGPPEKDPVVSATNNSEPASVTFGKSLAASYKTLIYEEVEKYQYEFDKSYFERKLKAAEEGKNVLPEDPARYGIKGAGEVALKEARARLVSALDGGGRAKVPALAAKAQTKFDSWVWRAGARLPSESLKEAEFEFLEAVRWLEDAVAPLKASDEFNRTLAREYFAYADFEAKDQKDYIDSRHFGRKAKDASQAAKVDEVLPEVLARWNLLAEDDVPTFVEWRARLIRALERHRTSSKARIAALAQVRFDCWVERTSERNDQAYIQKCRTEFLDYMRQLEGAAPTDTKSFIVYFDFDKSNIRPSELEKIRQAAQVAQQTNAQSISVVGHTDRAGSARYNVRLSFRRAEIVAQQLRRLGVRADRIRTLYLGETQPRVPTPDGVRNQENRRTEIVIR